MVFLVSPSKPESTAAAMRISTIVAVSCSHRIFSGVRPPRSMSSFTPYLLLFSSTCVGVRPVSEEEASSFKTAWVSIVCQFMFCFRFPDKCNLF